MKSTTEAPIHSQGTDSDVSALPAVPCPSAVSAQVDGFDFRQILCPTDFSDPARDAAEVAALLASKQKLALRLQHYAPELIAAADYPAFEKLDDSRRRHLEAERARLSPMCDSIAGVLSHGNAGLDISSAAGDNTEMIVIGSTGKGRAEHWLLGSTAERIAENAPVPTLVVRKPEILLGWLREKRLLRVLCAVDFTVSADAAMSMLKRLQSLGGEVELEAAYIVRADDASIEAYFGTASLHDAAAKGGPDLERDLWERLHDVLGDIPAEVHVRITEGSRAREFLRLAKDRGADLLVVGTHQTHGLRRLMSPSFSKEVLAYAPSNVLCVPLSSYHPEFHVPRVHRVLVATDFSESGNSVLQHAYGLLLFGGAVKIIHVCAGLPPGPGGRTISNPDFDAAAETVRNKVEAEQRIKSLVPHQLSTSGVKTTTEVLVSMDTPGAICEAAQRFGADVICMGSRSASRVAKMLTGGSTCQGVIARSHIPVFTVTPPKL